MTDLFVGKTVVVAGGATGIGRASAIWFARQGANVFVADYDPVAESEVEFAKLGIVLIQCDVRIEAEVKRLVDTAASTGRIDVLIGSAGVEMIGQIPDIAESDWDRCIDTNVKGLFLLAKHVIPIMASGGGGSIIHIASNAGLLPRSHDPVYSVSKSAVIALTKALALCHAKDRIRVNALCPGPVGGTRMMDDDVENADDPERRKREVIAACPIAKALDRMATAEEMAEAIGYLANPSSAFVTGAILAIDGGKSLGVPPYYRPAEV